MPTRPSRSAARCVAAVVALLLHAACPAPASSHPHDRPDDAGAGAWPIAWRLTAEPATATITMAQRRTFRIWMEARNVGGRVEDTRRDALEWLLNGQPSRTAAMAFGNGGREAAWGALPPGTTVREARDMGESLFPAPGSYELVVRRGGREVARLRVRVVGDVGSGRTDAETSGLPRSSTIAATAAGATG